MPAGTDARSARKEATHEAIRGAAAALLEERGYDDTTASDIARAAGVSERTFFRHFPTKEDVAFDGHAERLLVLASALAERPATEPILESVRASVLSLADEFEAGRESLLRLKSVMARSAALTARAVELQADFTGLIAGHVARRLDVDPQTDLVPGLVANVVVGAITASIATWLANGGTGDLVAIVEEALGLLDDGLGLDH